MESGAISDGQLSASSEWNPNVGAKHARLHSKWNVVTLSGGAWIAGTSDVNQWLQIDMQNQYTTVTRVATQGRNHFNYRWVTKYKLQYSNNTVTFLYHREKGRTTDKVGLVSPAENYKSRNTNRLVAVF